MTDVMVPPGLFGDAPEVTVSKWFKKPGEAVKQDEVLGELETDKVSVEFCSPVTGVLAEILAPEGTTVAANARLAIVTESAAGATISDNPKIEAVVDVGCAGKGAEEVSQRKDVKNAPYKVVAETAVRQFAALIEDAESKPVTSTSYSDLLLLNDLAINCGSALLRLRASVFAEKRKHEAAGRQVALGHEREMVEIKRMATEQMEIAARDFKAAQDVVKRKAQEDYDALCKMYNQKRPDFERMHVPMPRTPSLSEKIGSAGETGPGFSQALSDWMSYAAIPSPNAPLYGWSYAGSSVVLGFLLESLLAGFFLGLVVPASLYFLFIKAQMKLQELGPALERDRARLVRRMDDPIGAASKRLNARREAINSTLTKELEEIAEKQTKDADRLKSSHESSKAELKDAITSFDARMISLFSRLTKLEAEWQAHNRQSTSAFSEKPLEWEVPAPKILRLGTLGLTERGLVQMASSWELH